MASSKGMKVKTALVIGFLGMLTLLKPALCRAQAEIDPDHYESINTESFAFARAGTTPNRNADSSQGEFALPFDVAYRGQMLRRGDYSLSFQSLQNANIVTLTRDENAAKAQAIKVRLSFRSNLDGRRALVLDRTRQRHALTAICRKEAGTIFDLHAEPTKSARIDTVLVPISSPAHKVSKN